jgi:IS605 OrfB family transposase
MILATTLQGTIHNLTNEADTALVRTGRIFQAARRTAYGRLNEGLERDDIDPGLRDRFRMDARFARDAILEAEANRSSMRELLPEYLANTKLKITKVEARLKDYRTGKRKPKRVTLEVALTSLERRLTKLRAKRDKWQAHLDVGTLPPVIFGGAAAFHTRRKGRISRARWRAHRRAQFWSRGEKHKDGNLHTRIKPKGDSFTISIATLPMVKGHLTYVSADLWLPEKKRALLRAGLTSAYSVRIIRSREGWKAHITVREQVRGELLNHGPDKAITGGLDCNTDRLTIAAISPQGNLLARHTVWMPDLGDMRANKARLVIGNALTEALKWLSRHEVTCLVVEKLKFAQDHDTHHRSNRSTTKFRSTMVKLAIQLALRRGISVVQVNPAYTSVIGKYKYAIPYGMSGHEAAAYVIARRGQGREERLPKEIVTQLPQLREQLIAAAKTKPAQDRERAKFLRWAEKIADWKNQHLWSLWSIWDKAARALSLKMIY